jgi:hypothetical protein
MLMQVRPSIGYASIERNNLVSNLTCDLVRCNKCNCYFPKTRSLTLIFLLKWRIDAYILEMWIDASKEGTLCRRIRGSHSDGYEEHYLLGYNAL